MNRPDAINLYTMLLNVARGEPFLSSQSVGSRQPAPKVASAPKASMPTVKHKVGGAGVPRSQPVTVFSR